MKTRLLYTFILICSITFFSCSGQSKNSDSIISVKDSVNADENFKAALREQLSEISDVNKRAEKEQEEIIERMEQQRKEEERDSRFKELLQGTWEWSGDIKISSYRSQKTVCQLVFDGDYITEYNDGNLVGNSVIRNIDYENGKLYYGNDTYLEFVIDDEENVRLYGDKKRGIKFKKLSQQSIKIRENYNKHLKWWKDSYNEYMNPNPYWNSRPESIKGMQRALDYLWDDVRMSGNREMEEQVKELIRITSGLNPY